MFFRLYLNIIYECLEILLPISAFFFLLLDPHVKMSFTVVNGCSN